MNKSTEEREQHLARLKREVTKRGFDRHASLLKSTSELPAEFQSHDVVDVTANEDIKTIIAFPQQLQHGWSYVPKQALLFTPTDAIHLVASIWPDQEPQVTYINGRGLMYMKVKLLLLYGFLEIIAHGNTFPAHLSMEFNTVAWSYLSLPLRQLLQTSIVKPGVSTNEGGHSQTVQQALDDLPLKFSNGVKIFGNLSGEQLEELVFQPGVWKRWLRFFQRPITANTLLLLTSNYVIVIQEELKVPQGWVLSYIPRECIVEIQNQTNTHCNELIIRMKRGDQSAEYELLLNGEAAEVWRARWTQHGGRWQDLPGLKKENLMMG